MKRMVLIPEEKLLRYKQRERQDNNQAIEEGTPDGRQKGEGSGLGEFAASDMGGKGENELADDVIVRGIPKTMKTRAMALLGG